VPKVEQAVGIAEQERADTTWSPAQQRDTHGGNGGHAGAEADRMIPSSIC
jgi:hypothetical protein